MPALVAGIHVFLRNKQAVDGRDKPGHDGGMMAEQRREHREPERMK
jgi:hypothetical protein